MAQRERIITDVEEACALREAGLLWRRTEAGSVYYLGPTCGDAWLPNSIRNHSGGIHVHRGSFFIVLED